MRVSERQRYDTVSNRIEAAKDANKTMLEQLSTQKQINVISDSPVGTTQMIRYKNRIGSMGQFQKNVEYSKGMIERSESALNNLQDNLIRAKELAVGMANDTYDIKSRQATAQEVKQIIDEVVQIGNSTYNNRYIFGGFRNQTPPIGADGTYMGDDGIVFLQTSEKKFQQVNLQARDLFEATPDEAQRGHFNLIESLETLYHGLMSNDKDSITSALGELDHQLDKSSSYQATLGSMWASLNQTFTRLDKDQELTTKSLSEIEDVDAYKATSDFKRTETILQSTLMASNKLLQPSLFNFMQ